MSERSWWMRWNLITVGKTRPARMCRVVNIVQAAVRVVVYPAVTKSIQVRE
ncbi:MAG: hypothetical protein ABIT23_01165 [Nitrosospira sp.]